MELIPGFAMGITRVTISYPFETIKNNMQINKYDSSYIAFKNIIKKNPINLYRGSSFQYFFVPIDRSVQFYYCEKMKNKYNNYINGAISGAISSLYNIPLSYINCNVMTTDKKIKNIIRDMKKNNLFYNGGYLEFLRSVISPSIYIGIYFNLREKYPQNNIFTYALYGYCANISCWLCTYPIDTIRVEYQTSEIKNINKIIIKRYKKYGFFNFYKGISMILIRTLPSSIIGMYVYEKTKEILQLK